MLGRGGMGLERKGGNWWVSGFQWLLALEEAKARAVKDGWNSDRKLTVSAAWRTRGQWSGQPQSLETRKESQKRASRGGGGKESCRFQCKFWPRSGAHSGEMWSCSARLKRKEVLFELFCSRGNVCSLSSTKLTACSSKKTATLREISQNLECLQQGNVHHTIKNHSL